MEVIKVIENTLDWEEALKEIVIMHNMDPLNIDIEKLVNLFLDYIRKMKELNFTVPARFILIASILLRIKCENLFKKKEEREVANEEEILDINAFPEMEVPILRPPIRNVSFDELVSTLKKIVEEKERKEKRREIFRRVEEEIKKRFEEIENIDYEKLILEELRKIGKELIEFSQICNGKKIEEVVRLFLALLYIANLGKIRVEQRELFGEIKIWMLN